MGSYLWSSSSRCAAFKNVAGADRVAADDRRDDLIEWETHSSLVNAHLLRKLADDDSNFALQF